MAEVFLPAHSIPHVKIVLSALQLQLYLSNSKRYDRFCHLLRPSWYCIDSRFKHAVARKYLILEFLTSVVCAKVIFGLV